ncbi:hypothetical protein [Enterobacter hormaechei]|uniref:hypothetical protein n=1 Tax=Enterobacter hormaechei TaxID=158836 RepID=UPI003CC75C85
MKNNEIWNPAGSVELAHQQALTWVSDAYLFYLVSLHRRPVYRHQYGDISLNQPALQAFIDSYLADKGWSIERRRAHYIDILDPIKYIHRSNSDFIDWGTVPTLTPRGICWLNACFSRLGEMVNSYGGWEQSVKMMESRKVAGETHYSRSNEKVQVMQEHSGPTFVPESVQSVDHVDVESPPGIQTASELGFMPKNAGLLPSMNSTLVNGVTIGKPLTITLPDISSKAFWSDTGKSEAFHPDTYRRWAKEAIERDCAIANIDVKVK